MPRSIFYVDGFNLYYGSLKSGRYKWLNLERYFRLLRKDDDLVHVHYFTALIDGPWRHNQLDYLRALGTLQSTTAHLGSFKTKRVPCGVVGCTHHGDKRFPMREEKRTDVHIAVQMLCDAFEDNCDLLVLISGDSDLVPAIHAVKARFPQKKVVVYVPSRSPARGAAVELRGASDRHRTLPLGLLKAAQFPAVMVDRNGLALNKPTDWL